MCALTCADVALPQRTLSLLIYAAGSILGMLYNAQISDRPFNFHTMAMVRGVVGVRARALA